MKTSIIISLCVIILCSSFKGRAQTVQYVTLVNTNITSFPVYYSLQTNQIVSCVGTFDGTAASSGSVVGTHSIGYYIALPIPGSGPFQMFTGLTNVWLQTRSMGTFCATLQITTPAAANVISNYVPADAIVIPASATGNVQIILESSTDLLNWTAANPGTYSAASTTNRFFRVRAVHN